MCLVFLVRGHIHKSLSLGVLGAKEGLKMGEQVLRFRSTEVGLSCTTVWIQSCRGFCARCGFDLTANP